MVLKNLFYNVCSKAFEELKIQHPYFSEVLVANLELSNKQSVYFYLYDIINNEKKFVEVDLSEEEYNTLNENYDEFVDYAVYVFPTFPA